MGGDLSHVTLTMNFTIFKKVSKQNYNVVVFTISLAFIISRESDSFWCHILTYPIGVLRPTREYSRRPTSIML